MIIIIGLVLLLFENQGLRSEACVSKRDVVLFDGPREATFSHIVSHAKRIHRVDGLGPVKLVVRSVELAQASRVCLAWGPSRRAIPYFRRCGVFGLPVHVGARGMLTLVLRAVCESL